MKRFYFTSLVAIMLFGCEGPKQVLTILPPPVTPRRPIAPTYVKPTPTPPTTPSRSVAGSVIVIDPGHGGKDPGTTPRTSPLPEKTIVLDIANKVSRLLRERGAKVHQTRTSDRFVQLENRAAMAERTRADLFVSIHANYSPRSSVAGATIHIYDNASIQSRRAGLRMVATFNQAGIECGGIIPSNFHVLREHSRPAMLIECGFLSNRGDARLLNTASYRARIAAVIADGIAAYCSR